MRARPRDRRRERVAREGGERRVEGRKGGREEERKRGREEERDRCAAGVIGREGHER